MAKFKKTAMLCAAILAIASLGAFVACEETHVHTYGSEWSKDANNHWYDCKNEACTGEEVGKKGHNFNDGVVTKEATLEEAGEKTYTCVVCGYEKKEEIEKLQPVVYAEPTEGDGSIDTPYVIGAGTYKNVVINDSENGLSYTHYVYTATEAGAFNVSYEDENAYMSIVINNDTYITLTIGETAIPVAIGDTIELTISTSWEYSWAEGETSYDVIFSVTTSTEAPEATGTSYNPFILTAEEIEENYGEIPVSYDVSVDDAVHYKYTVTGDDTAGLWVLSSSELTGVSSGNNNFYLTGGYDEYYNTNQAYLPAKKGDVIVFQVSPTSYAIEKATLSFGLTETNEAYEDGSALTPYLIAADGEAYTDLVYPASPFMGYGDIYFSYTASEDGFLTVSGAIMLYEFEDVSYLEVTAGETYVFSVPFDWMTQATTVSPVFTFAESLPATPPSNSNDNTPTNTPIAPDDDNKSDATVTPTEITTSDTVIATGSYVVKNITAELNEITLTYTATAAGTLKLTLVTSEDDENIFVQLGNNANNIATENTTSVEISVTENDVITIIVYTKNVSETDITFTLAFTATQA